MPTALALVSAALVGCDSSSPKPRSAEESAAPAAARADLRLLAEEMEEIHPDLFHSLPRAEWEEAVAALDERLPTLDANETLVELMRLVALVSTRGREGHLVALPPDERQPPVYPLRLYPFADGLFVIAALPPHEDLVGARVEAIAGRPVVEVLAAVEPLVPRDSDATVPMWLPRYLIMPNLFQGLGLAGPPPTDFTVTDADGRERTVAVGTVPMAEYVAWAGTHEQYVPPERPDSLWLGRMDETFWWRYLPGSRTLFVQLNMTYGPGADEAERLRRRAERDDVDRVVLDLRHNLGGDNTTYGPLLAALQSPAIDRPGRLFVVIGRATFSAAGNLATELDLTTGAVFVGEPMGGGLNQYGDSRMVTLERLPIPLTVHVPVVYVEKAPGDERLTLVPDLPAPVTSSAYFAGEDPALAAILGTPRR